MSLGRALVLLIVFVLAVALVPAGIVLNGRLADALLARAREELVLAPRLLGDRRAASAEAMMMHAKDLSHAPGLAEAIARGDRAGARRLLDVARAGYGEAAVLAVGNRAPWSGPALPAGLLDETRRGEMPVAVVWDSATLHTVALAPVVSRGRWVAAVGVASEYDEAEAARLSGLTRSDVMIRGPRGVLAVSTARGIGRLADTLTALAADDSVREVRLDGHRYLVLVTPVSREGAIAFVRDLQRELALLPELRGVAALVGALALSLALLLGAGFAGAVARPVRALADAADRLARGDFDAPLRPARISEVTRLALAFGAMRRALQARVIELEDRQRRLTALQSELIQRDRLAATGRLVVQLAHEIRNPVANVRNCLELIRRRARGDERMSEFADLAVGELLRMHAMAEQLLDLHRPRSDAGRECDAGEVVRETAALLRIGDPEHVFAITVTGDSRAEVAIAPDALKQVLLNLCHNARDAMDGAGTVEINLTSGDLNAIITVCDAGPGIAPEALERVFDPFFTTKRAVHGVGLGLFVAEGIVRSHGGSVTAGNRDDGRGARFVITLPAARAARVVP